MTPRRLRCPLCRTAHTLLREEPLRVLRRTPATLARELRRSRRRDTSSRPAPRQWAPSEIVAHLADAEIALAFRLRKMAAERHPTLAAWDQEAWAEAFRYRAADPRSGLATFDALRRANLALLARLRPGWRKRSGRHPEYGKLTMAELVAHYAEHDLNHLRQLRAVRQALSVSRAARPGAGARGRAWSGSRG